MSDDFGKEVPKLGFALMRLPRKGLATAREQVAGMVDLFMESGFTYFDTAFVYPGSEAAMKKALVDRYPRESFTVATKLNAAMLVTDGKGCQKAVLHQSGTYRCRVFRLLSSAFFDDQ